MPLQSAGSKSKRCISAFFVPASRLGEHGECWAMTSFCHNNIKEITKGGVERSEHRWIQIGYSNYAGFSVSHERPDHNAKLCKALDLPPAVMGFKSTVSSCLAAKFHVRRTSSKCSTSLRVWSAKAKSLDLQFAAVRRKRHTCISHYRSISVNNSGHATVNLSGGRFHGPDLMGLCTEFNEAMIFSCPKKQV